MYKPLFFIAFILSTVMGCSSSKYYMQSGAYDEAVYAAINSLRNNKKNEKEALRLEESYRITQEKDFATIKQLKAEGNPANYRTIYNTYLKINARQNAVKPLLPLYMKKKYRHADIQIVDIVNELADSKNKTAEYLYQSANKLMTSNVKADYRKAYDLYTETNSIYAGYKDISEKMKIATEKGKVIVGVIVKNNARVILPKDFDQTIRDFSTWGLDNQWVKFDKNYNTNTIYDYAVVMTIDKIDVTPERVNTREFDEMAIVPDGFEYVYDKKGNVMKDSLGNDIKKPKSTKVSAHVLETVQTKSAFMGGNWEITNLKNGQQLANVPFGETVNFENFYAVFRGDKRALTKNTLQRIGGKPLLFPTEFQMINDASLLAKAKLKNTLQINVNTFLQ